MTGTSASGYRCLITDHEPWSKPHLSSNCTSVLLTKSLVICANCGLPGAGYCTSKSSCGNAPKSCIVTGFSIAVTYVPLVSQCAEITSIAFGFSIVWDMLRKPWTNSFSSIAFIGLPWPRNNTGILEVSESSSVNLFKLLSFAIEPVWGSAAAAAKNCFLFMSSILLPLFVTSSQKTGVFKSREFADELLILKRGNIHEKIKVYRSTDRLCHQAGRDWYTRRGSVPQNGNQ